MASKIKDILSLIKEASEGMKKHPNSTMVSLVIALTIVLTLLIGPAETRGKNYTVLGGSETITLSVGEEKDIPLEKLTAAYGQYVGLAKTSVNATHKVTVENAVSRGAVTIRRNSKGDDSIMLLFHNETNGEETIYTVQVH